MTITLRLESIVSQMRWKTEGNAGFALPRYWNSSSATTRRSPSLVRRSKRTSDQLVARERGHLFLEGRAVLFLRLLRRQEVQRALVADELGDERRLPDAAPAVDDRHGRLVVGELLLQGGEFFNAIDERVHNCPFLSHASLEGYYTSKYYTSKYNLMHVQLTQGLLALFFTFRIIFRERRRCARMRGCVCVRSASSG